MPKKEGQKATDYEGPHYTDFSEDKILNCLDQPKNTTQILESLDFTDENGKIKEALKTPLHGYLQHLVEEGKISRIIAGNAIIYMKG